MKKPKILLLDEATSALDKQNERAIQAAIDAYRKTHGDITTIVIAHRLSTIRDADKIVVVKAGKLVEMGNHDELLQQYPDGVYHTFCKKQESAEAQQPAEGEEEEELEIVTKEEAGVKRQITRKKTMMDPIEKAKMTAANDADDEYEKELEELKKKNNETSAFSKLAAYNNPKIYVFFACLASLIDGAAMPVMGILFSQILSALSLPFFHELDPLTVQKYGVVLDATANTPSDEARAFTTYTALEDTVNKNAMYIACIGAGIFLSALAQRYFFQLLGGTVTLKIRELLYFSILQKHIGWFDRRENGASVLTSAMAMDTSLINGVSCESLGPQVEASGAMLVGIAIALVYCWQEALVCLAVSPAMIIGNAIGMKFMSGLTEGTNELTKEANLLCGDAIMNYKTVQSFGHEDRLVAKYKELLSPVNEMAKATYLKIGFSFGFSQFCQYAVFAAMFYSAALLIDHHTVFCEDGVTVCEITIDAEAVFIALFCIMFGASQAGMAQAFGPDMAKATTAAERVFGIIETPSRINAVQMDSKPEQKRIDASTFEGRIEFRDVWFRYPTRKEDFVLRGLNLTVNPNERVALVGESGCGKSTFVNLLMRFYDVDHGAVLVDGVDVREYNLHDLRKVVSLVMQEPIIFNYSILENVLYGKSDASNTEV